jgi:exonuclease III
MQYNVEWLFIDYYSNMNCPGEGCTWKNITEAETHMDYVAKRIQSINPDIINLCEVEGCDELNLLKDKLDGTYNPYLIKGTDASTGQNVGMLTRVDPINNSNCGYTGTQETTGVSKHYITEFQFNGLNIAFISAHLIAIPTDKSRCAQREAQAMILQSVIMGFVQQNYEIIMIGDFNDFDAEIMDVNDSKPTSQVLDILKGLKGDFAGKYLLNSIAETIEYSERYSDWWDSDNNCNTSSIADYSMIDHILVTDAIRNNIVNSFVYHEYDEYCGKYDSDHFPVVIDLLSE